MVAITVEIVKIAKLATIKFLVANRRTMKQNIVDIIIPTMVFSNIDFC